MTDKPMSKMKIFQTTRTNNRKKGVLLPVFSLPSEYGIGSFSQEAREFIDWLKETGHEYWQILPLNPTGVADSPYQPLSSFAGNAYFIDPQQLVRQGLLSQEELDGFDFGSDPDRVEYEILYGSRMKMLRLAHRRFAARREEFAAEWEQFAQENAFWLPDYALFMALREEFGKELSWDDWPDELRCRQPEALAKAGKTHAETVDFYSWTQFEFYRQWKALKEYANTAGVKIIGDMPIYVSYDSADCWADPDQFQLDEDRRMTMIAGVPPDDFAEEGQLWGNPLYDWDKMEKNGYAWWISRIRQSFVLYDVIRLDHFRGYEAYYSCLADAENGKQGTWRPGPGMELFRLLETDLGLEESAAEPAEDGRAEPAAKAGQPLRERFVAEDLGFLTDGVKQLLEETGFPGTKVLQFAFDGDPENPYLPENYSENCVVYTGTHDNDTTVGWFHELSGDDQAGILQYLGYSSEDAWKLVLEYDAYRKSGADSDVPPDPAVPATDLLIQKALDSPAKITIVPLQDYFHLDSEFRTNTPGTVGENWRARIPAAREMERKGDCYAEDTGQ